ncbi:energy-coupling factor transport system ATP-binding protein [Scopulibacillus darangshiensis]|uniref:Energy-coupling factor transporter ATP-binding protein EcfA2 n=1 Tax=Scopulibacillus darangshiensis TaxID=442528 RepID=A0A4R2NR62_9BACL|nr:energy-coupling factor ABC transporter ATP-binding protein [Scopulibacillus darangshiensis]TCP24192.1 energy-coupling factor transport system ATP-binding protein [Scopulibacillus darangshiensis]
MDITIKNLTHLYHPNTPFERIALRDINLQIKSGSFVSVIGHTGSGKSTLVQHINGLLKPSRGEITVGDVTIKAREKAPRLKDLRKRVGLVFQYPEHQLFEETVEKDLCFGPMNFGLPLEEAKAKAHQALKLVGLPQDFLQRSPFDLSGGQMRRVAIAGVLAVEPEVIILDEPTAGLDPMGRRDILSLFERLHEEKAVTTIMVTHSMDDAAYYSDKVLVMDRGQVVMMDKPEHVFSDSKQLKQLGLDIPVTMNFLAKLNKKVHGQSVRPVFSIEETADAAIKMLRQGRGETGHV